MNKETIKTIDQMYYDGKLKSAMDTWKARARENWDFLIGIDGREGAGKSVFAQQMGLYLDPTLCLDRIVFTGEQFMDAIKKAEKYECIIFDEAFGALSSTNAIRGFNRTIMKALREIRRKNLFLIIVMPSFFDFTKYIALHRSIALFHVYVDENYKRGRFLGFDRKKKNDLYIKGKEFYNYTAVKSSGWGTFAKGWAVDYAAYDRKKEVSTDEAEDENMGMRDAWSMRDNLILKAKEDFKWDQKRIAEEFKLTQQRVSQILKKQLEDK